MRRFTKTEVAAGIVMFALLAWAIYVLVATEHILDNLPH